MKPLEAAGGLNWHLRFQCKNCKSKFHLPNAWDSQVRMVPISEGDLMHNTLDQHKMEAFRIFMKDEDIIKLI